MRWFALLLALSIDPSLAEGDRSALMIIDMQDSFSEHSAYPQDPKNQEKLKQVLEAQKAAIQAARQARLPIIVVEYKNWGKTTESLRKALEGYDNTHYVTKNHDGLFYDSNAKESVEALMKKNDVKTLIVTGANGGACVRSTIIGALDLNYHVIAYRPGIVDFNFPQYVYPFTPYTGAIRLTCFSCTLKDIDKPEDLLKLMRVGRAQRMFFGEDATTTETGRRAYE